MVKISSKKGVTKKVHRSDLQKKILLLLQAGLVLGLTRNPKQYFNVISEVQRGWQSIDRNSLNRAIRTLYKSKLVSTRCNRDGTMTLVLSKEGDDLALTYSIENMGIQRPTHWDRRWRIVMFDVPETHKKIRDTLRMHFKNMEFYFFYYNLSLSCSCCFNKRHYWFCWTYDSACVPKPFWK